MDFSSSPIGRRSKFLDIRDIGEGSPGGLAVRQRGAGQSIAGDADPDAAALRRFLARGILRAIELVRRASSLLPVRTILARPMSY
jgi:hypothetical protein